MPTQQELDADKEARSESERKNQELLKDMAKMRDEFKAWHEGEKERMEHYNVQRETDRQRLAEMSASLERAIAAQQEQAEAAQTARGQAEQLSTQLALLQQQAPGSGEALHLRKGTKFCRRQQTMQPVREVYSHHQAFHHQAFHTRALHHKVLHHRAFHRQQPDKG